MPAATLISTVPHSTEAEATVLGALLTDPDAIFTVAARLKADDFHDPVHRGIYDAIFKLMEEGIAVDFVTVANKLRDVGVIDRMVNLTAEAVRAGAMSLRGSQSGYVRRYALVFALGVAVLLSLAAR